MRLDKSVQVFDVNQRRTIAASQAFQDTLLPHAFIYSTSKYKYLYLQINKDFLAYVLADILQMKYLS